MIYRPSSISEALVLPVKLFKRLVVDLPTVCICWTRFYASQKKVGFTFLRSLRDSGFAEVTFLLDSKDMYILQQLFEGLDFSFVNGLSGQERGRIFSQGLLDDRLEPVVSKFRDVAKGYLNTQHPHLELTYFQVSCANATQDSIPGGTFHMDDSKPNLKFFVYLTDVDVDQGPFCVVPASHGLRRSKGLRYLIWTLTKRRSSLYSNELLDKQLDLKKKLITGKRGFSFVTDTTAWHRATQVKEGRRVVFVCSFNYGH
jgi:hypothetical protein